MSVNIQNKKLYFNTRITEITSLYYVTCKLAINTCQLFSTHLASCYSSWCLCANKCRTQALSEPSHLT